MLTLADLCERDVVSVGNGENLGRVDDLCVDETAARVTALVIYGRLRWFGLLGREEDRVFPWEAVRRFGADTILVETPPLSRLGKGN